MSVISSQEEINEKLTSENLKTVQFILPTEDNGECAMIVGTKMFSSMYIIPSDKFLDTFNHLYDKSVLIFKFTDSELTDAWKESYAKGGIPKEQWDRRTIFHPYDEMNEMFCIDSLMYEEICGENQDRYDLPSWKEGIVEWYRDKILYTPKAEELKFEWGMTFVPKHNV